MKSYMPKEVEAMADMIMATLEGKCKPAELRTIKQEWIKSVKVKKHKIVFYYTGNKKIVRAVPEAMVVMILTMKELGNYFDKGLPLKMVVNINPKSKIMNFSYQKRPSKIQGVDKTKVRVYTRRK